MKKFKAITLFIIGIILLIGVYSAMADSEEPVNTAIDSSSWTEIALNGNVACTSYIFQTRDGSDFKWKKTAASTNYFTIRDGAAFSVTFARQRQPTTLFYAQSVSGTPVIEVFVFNQN